MTKRIQRKILKAFTLLNDAVDEFATIVANSEKWKLSDEEKQWVSELYWLVADVELSVGNKIRRIIRGRD